MSETVEMPNHFRWDKITTAGEVFQNSLYIVQTQARMRARVYCVGACAQKNKRVMRLIMFLTTKSMVW